MANTNMRIKIKHLLRKITTKRTGKLRAKEVSSKGTLENKMSLGNEANKITRKEVIILSHMVQIRMPPSKGKMHSRMSGLSTKRSEW